MAVTRLADVVKPDVFTAYMLQNSIEKTHLAQSGIIAANAEMAAQLAAGADSFHTPFWKDLGDDEADITSDDPARHSTPRKRSAGKQITRKSYLHASWSHMNLAAELSGDSPDQGIQERIASYWQRQTQRRLVASLAGILADNIANDGGDMVNDISAKTGTAAIFSAAAVIDAAATLGDSMRELQAIAMHSKTYQHALKSDLIQTMPQSDGGFIQTFRGLGIVIDDGLPSDAGKYTTVLFGAASFGCAMSAPRKAAAVEVENVPSAGNGGGQHILHSRVNLALHPLGFSWKEASVAHESPSIAELAMAANWDRVCERKHVPLAFLIHKL